MVLRGGCMFMVGVLDAFLLTHLVSAQVVSDTAGFPRPFWSISALVSATSARI